MSVDLPTEEDVLAVGLLCWFVYETEEGGRGVPSEWADDFSGAACAVWHARRDALGTLGAIADSERRLEVERAMDAVLHSVAYLYGSVEGRPLPLTVEVAYTRLMLAEAEVSRHGG